MDSMSMVERVARAINPFEWEAFDENRFPLEKREKEHLHSWKKDHAALQALMTPTPGMIEVGQAELECPNDNPQSVAWVWQAMIRSAMEGE